MCAVIDLFINFTDRNSPDSSVWEPLKLIEETLLQIPDYVEKMKKEPQITPADQLTLWLKCEKCNQFPGIEFGKIEGKDCLVCENCGHHHIS